MASWSESFPNSGGSPVAISAVDMSSGLPIADQKWVQVGPAGNDTQIPSGGGGLSQIEPITGNWLPVWGRTKTRFDSGTIRFKVGRRNSGDATSARYGVHFQTDQGDETAGSNTGYIVVVQSSDGTVRLGTVAGTSITYLFVSPLPTVAKNEYVEVVWGPRGITGESKYINVYKYDSNLQNRTLILSDTPGTILSPGGGRIGVCAAASEVSAASGEDLWITQLYFRDTARRLADYGDTTSGSGANTYKNTPGRLYEYPTSTHSNAIPQPLRERALRLAEQVEPLRVVNPLSSNATMFDPLQGRIGFVNIGISNTGDFFNALLPQLLGTRPNGAVQFINAAREVLFASVLANATKEDWLDVDARLLASGLQRGALAGLGPSPQTTIRTYPQVQVVLTCINNRWNADNGALFDGTGATGNAATMRDNLDDMLTNLVALFPNLRLVLAYDGNCAWCEGNAGNPQAGDFADPGLAEQWKWGFKWFISERVATEDGRYTDWLVETWNNTIDDAHPELAWDCATKMWSGGPAHPNAAGEELGSSILLPALQKHVSTQAWLPATPRLRTTVLNAQADTYTNSQSGQTNTNYGTETILKNGKNASGSIRFTTYVRFDARNFPRPVRRAILNLLCELDGKALPCDVEIVSSYQADTGALWIESGTGGLTETIANAQLGLLESNAFASAPGSRSHPVGVDVTELFNRQRGKWITFRLRPNSSDTAEGFRWYSKRSTLPNPRRPAKLVLIEKGVDEPFTYLERAVDSMLAERLR